jgi:hypothetical protein
MLSFLSFGFVIYQRFLGHIVLGFGLSPLGLLLEYGMAFLGFLPLGFDIRKVGSHRF